MEDIDVYLPFHYGKSYKCLPTRGARSERQSIQMALDGLYIQSHSGIKLGQHLNSKNADIQYNNIRSSDIYCIVHSIFTLTLKNTWLSAVVLMEVTSHILRTRDWERRTNIGLLDIYRNRIVHSVFATKHRGNPCPPHCLMSEGYIGSKTLHDQRRHLTPWPVFRCYQGLWPCGLLCLLPNGNINYIDAGAYTPSHQEYFFAGLFLTL